MNVEIVSPKLQRSNLPFAHGVRAGNMIFTSGQTGTDPKTGQVVEGIEAQTNQCLSNVEAVLEAVGYTRKDVVKVTVFLADMRDYGAMNKIYSTFFSEPYPARSTIEAKLANQNMRVEIEAIAAR
ncbi:RidA family protein [Candidatus Bathyarchaeota archaeon]|nr:RidA family protein [Candidatus Bathyarchaeota archaeon]